MKIYIIYTSDRKVLDIQTSYRKAISKAKFYSDELFPDSAMLGTYESGSENNNDDDIFDNVELIEY